MLGLWDRQPKFERLEDNEECESLTSEEKDTIQLRSHQKSRWTTRILMMLIHLTIFLVGMFTGINFIGAKSPGGPSTQGHDQGTRYTPVMGDIGFNYQDVRFNGSLFKKNDFRQQAGPVVDAAWESLGVDYRSAIVPPEMGEATGMSESFVQVNDKYGGGWMANVEGLHHLHCLNLVRKALYWNYDYYHAMGKGAFKNEDYVVEAHVSHCLDIIRQQLMCTVDVGVLGQVWWSKENPQAYPDFDTEHRCRNFEAIRHWAEEHQAPVDTPEDFLKPPRYEDVLDEIP